MKIALLGYGKMGKAIEQFVKENTNHSIDLIIHSKNIEKLTSTNLENIDVAIDFSTPEVAPHHIITCLENNTPIVSGSTGWLHEWDEIIQSCVSNNGTFFYASNYSIGVNLFWKMIEQMGKIMQSSNDYSLKIDEIHHLEKKDAPSGTAITTAEKLMNQMSAYKKWALDGAIDSSEIPIFAHREKGVPGTHVVTFDSPIDTISIEHTAKSRLGFVMGAVKAAEFIANKTGIFGMNDLLKQD